MKVYVVFDEGPFLTYEIDSVWIKKDKAEKRKEEINACTIEEHKVFEDVNTKELWHPRKEK